MYSGDEFYGDDITSGVTEMEPVYEDPPTTEDETEEEEEFEPEDEEDEDDEDEFKPEES